MKNTSVFKRKQQDQQTLFADFAICLGYLWSGTLEPMSRDSAAVSISNRFSKRLTQVGFFVDFTRLLCRNVAEFADKLLFLVVIKAQSSRLVSI